MLSDDFDAAIDQAMSELALLGFLRDTGRKEWNARRGQWDTVWIVKESCYCGHDSREKCLSCACLRKSAGAA